jgi:hypothetical protein
LTSEVSLADAHLVTEPEAPPSDDIRSMVSSAFDEVTSKPDDPAPEPAEKPQTPAAERPRGSDGKFVKAEGDEAPEPLQATPKEPSEPAAPAPTQAEELGKATSRWSQADRDALAAAPQSVQELVVRRHREMEADHTRKTQEIASFRKDYEPIDQLLAPHADAMRERGFTKASLVRAWYDVERGLMAGGDIAAQLVAGIAKNYNLDRGAIARHLGLTAPSASPTEPPSPQAPANAPNLPPEIEQRLSRYDQFIQQQQQTEQQRQVAAYNDAANRVMTDIEKFAAETDSSGALQHPHFRDVENQMAVLAQVARASGNSVPHLSELYEQAVWANPSTREKLQAAAVASQEAQRAEADKQRQQEARAKAERATKAAKSTTGAPPSGPVRGKSGSLRDELLEAAEQLSA